MSYAHAHGNRARSTLVRGILAALMVIAMLGGMGYAAGSAASADNETEDLSVQPGISKSVTKIAGGDGDEYDLHLTASGDNASSHTTVATPADIVIVADKSGSMRDDNRDGNSRNAVHALAQKLLTPANAKLPDDQQIHMAVITFSTNSQLRQDFTNHAGDIDQAMEEAPDGGTNWEAALSQANKLQGRAGVHKFIIFLSDGNPTFRNTSRGACFRYGWKYESQYTDKQSCEAQNYRWVFDKDGNKAGVYGEGNNDTYGFNYDAALTVANQRGDAALYVVKTSEEANRMSDLAAQAGAVTGKEYDGTNAKNLAAAFQAIYTSIVSTATIKVFSITDTLSQWVDPVDFAGQPDGADITPYVTVRNGNTALTDYRAIYHVDQSGSRTVVVTFNGEDGVSASKADTIDVSYRIKLSDIAYTDYAQKRQYPDVGDAGTGGASAGEPGYAANGRAQMRYCALLDVNGVTTCEQKTVEYQHPVVQVKLGSIDITKWWSDGADKHKTDAVTVQLQRATAGQIPENVGAPIELNARNNWGAHIDGLLPGYTYSVVETSGDDRYAVTYQYDDMESPNGVELTKHMVWTNADTIHAVITNTLETADLSHAITVRKQLDGRAWTQADAFTFTLDTEDGSPMPTDCAGKERCTTTVKSDSPGHAVTFGDITYDAGAHTYHYSVSEQSGSSFAMHYSQAKYDVEVTVAKSNDGTWHASVSSIKQTCDDEGNPVNGNDGDATKPIDFTNRYVAVSQLPLTGGTTGRQWLLAGGCIGGFAVLLIGAAGVLQSRKRLV